MVLKDIQEFGGLEELAVMMSEALRRQGHDVSVICTTWTAPENQYVCALRENGVELVQPPRWLSLPASDWATKVRILRAILWLMRPSILVLAAGRFLKGECTWSQSVNSSRNWLQGQLMERYIGPERNRWLANLLLNWWKAHWSPDLLHVHGYTASLMYVVDWAFGRGVPVVYEEHSTPTAHFDWWNGFQDSINHASIVVAVSEKSAEALRSICGVTRPMSVLHPIVADPIKAGWRQRTRFRAGADEILVTTPARLYVAKGLTYLLDAISQVLARHPKVRFRVYGDGPLRDELLAYAASLGLNGKVIFVGRFARNELPTIMSNTDIFVLSSISEGQPLAIVEAMAYGCPIVTTAVGGIPEVIADGVNGLLCAPADPNCLAQKISLLVDNPDLSAKLGDAARASYLQGPFRPESVADQLTAIYTNALKFEKERLVARRQAVGLRTEMG